MSDSATLNSTTLLTSGPKKEKRSLGERLLSLMFDGPADPERKLRETYDEDRRDDIVRTEKEEKERQERIKKRVERVGGGDGVRTNDMQKEGWGGAMLAQGHA
jgi:hypothetical protein